MYIVYISQAHCNNSVFYYFPCSLNIFRKHALVGCCSWCGCTNLVPIHPYFHTSLYVFIRVFEIIWCTNLVPIHPYFHTSSYVFIRVFEIIWCTNSVPIHPYFHTSLYVYIYKGFWNYILQTIFTYIATLIP